MNLISAMQPMEFKDVAQAHTPDLQICASDPVLSVELRQLLPSQLSLISPFLDQFMAFIAAHRSVDGSEIEIELALREALINAVVHGNHEDPNKSVEVVCRCSTDGEVAIAVRDEGVGFDTMTIPDPTSKNNLTLTHGPGVYLMRALMDEVSFEDDGTVVYMRKNRTTPRGSPVWQLQ